MNLLDRITFNPRQCGGRPCVRGMRIRVSDVLDLLAVGLTAEQMHPDRMAFGAIMPILTAIGLAMVIKWRSSAGISRLPRITRRSSTSSPTPSR